MLIKIGNAWVDPEQIQAVRDMRTSDDVEPTLEIILSGDCCFDVRATMDEAEAALIDAGVIENPYPEDEDRIKLSEAEREELSALYEQGYEYIARDSDGKANAFKSEPIMGDGYYYPRNSEHAEPVAGAFECLDVIECFYIPFLLSE